MGERVRAFDWSTTPRGAIQDWPACQCTAASLVLASHVPSFLLWGRELTVVAYNDAYRPLLGSKPEALGRPVLDVWAEARDLLAPQLARAWAGEAVSFPATRATVLRGGEPEEGWFDYGFSPVHDEAGRVAGLFNTTIEITARVHAEAAQAESEARWRAVFDHMGEGFEIHEVILGPGGRAVDLRYLEINAAWERHSGFPRDKVMGRRVTEVFPPADTGFWINLLGQVVETGEPVHLERYFAPAAKWLEATAYRAGPQRVAVLTRDITERREAAERQKAALETGLIGFFEWDVAEGTISGDERFARFYGLDPAAAAAGVPRASLTARIHPGDRAAVQANVDVALASCREIANEFRITQPDGGLRWLLVRSRCTGQEGERPLRYTGTAVDVTTSRPPSGAARERGAAAARAQRLRHGRPLRLAHSGGPLLRGCALCPPLRHGPGSAGGGRPACRVRAPDSSGDWPRVEAAIRTQWKQERPMKPNSG
jgi:PAS domain S-box-containing protein